MQVKYTKVFIVPCKSLFVVYNTTKNIDAITINLNFKSSKTVELDIIREVLFRFTF